MTTYRYTAEDNEGRGVSGTLDAVSESAARQALTEQGLKVLALEAAPAALPLTTAEQEEVVERVQDVYAAGLPLSDGLRALAGEFETGSGWAERLSPGRLWSAVVTRRDHGRIRRALLRIASEVERGEPLDAVLERHNLPNAVAAVMRSGIPSGQATEAVNEYAIHTDSARSLRSRLWFVCVQPLIALALAALAAGVFLISIVPGFAESYEQFGIELPALTTFVLEMASVAQSINSLLPGLMLWGPPVALIALGLLIAGPGRRLLRKLPVIGVPDQDLAMARFSRVLAVVLRYGADIPNALRAAGRASRDRAVTRACDELARSAETGEDLPIADPVLAGFPLSFVVMAADGSDRDSVADGLHATANALERRSESLIVILAAVIHPALLVLICSGFVVGLVAVMLPIVQLFGLFV